MFQCVNNNFRITHHACFYKELSHKRAKVAFRDTLLTLNIIQRTETVRIYTDIQ